MDEKAMVYGASSVSMYFSVVSITISDSSSTSSFGVLSSNCTFSLLSLFFFFFFVHSINLLFVQHNTIWMTMPKMIKAAHVPNASHGFSFQSMGGYIPSSRTRVYKTLQI